MIFSAIAFSFLIGMEHIGFAVPDGVYIQEPYGFTELRVEYKPLPFMEIYGGVKTDFTHRDGVRSFTPFHSYYDIGIELSWGNLTIGAEHWCGHAQAVAGDVYGLEYDEGGERVWLRIIGGGE